MDEENYEVGAGGVDKVEGNIERYLKWGGDDSGGCQGISSEKS